MKDWVSLMVAAEVVKVHKYLYCSKVIDYRL